MRQVIARRVLAIALLLLLGVALFGCMRLIGDGPEIAPVGAIDTMRFEPENGLLRVLIGFDALPGEAEAAMIRGLGGKVRFVYSLVPAIAASVPEAAIQALQSNPRVTVVEPDVTIYALDYAAELDNTWGVKRIGAGVVHADGNQGSAVKVAIIDSGIDYTHPELSAQYKGGYDFHNNDSDPMDDNGHGTHVAGTVGAKRDGYGVVGVGPHVYLYGLKILGGDGSGSFSSAIAALEWCVDNGIQITNNSYGSSQDPGTIVQDAFDNAYAAGVLHVASAGNSGNPGGRGDNVGYPGAYSSVIAVAATTPTDSRASYSSTGPAVELAAPGSSINSTIPGGEYAVYSGTSMASPHVAGTAAVVWYANPGWSNTQIRQQLIDTAEDLGPTGWDPSFGHGLVRADLAVGASAPDPDPEPDPGPGPDPGTMYVADISMGFTYQGPFTRATATVTIMSSDGQLVDGAVVYGAWSGATSSSVSATTGTDGKVVFTSDRIRNPSSGTTFTLCVTDIVKSDWTYDATQNVETCDSISVP